MLQGIGGGGLDASQLRSLFSKLDSDANGTVSRDEFVSGAPSDVSSDQAGLLFDALDSSGSGALSESDLLSSFQQLSSQMQSSLIQQQQGGNRPQPPDPSEMFDKADANGDGTVTREEFVASRPGNVSEDQAGSLFDKLDSEGSGSLTKDQFVSAMEANKPEPPPTSADSSSQTNQLAQSYIELLKSYHRSTVSSSTSVSA